jgi:phosphonoacetaldehyde hydrolase
MTAYTYQRRYAGPLRAVILNWSGTVVDHGSRAPACALVELFDRHQVQINMPLIRTAMGFNTRDHLEAMTDMDQVALQWEQIHGCYPTQRDVYNLHREYLPLLASYLAAHADPIQHALETIENMRGMGVKIGVTSSYNSETTRILSGECARNGFEPDVSICDDQVPAGRPQPWMCFKAAQELQVFPMEAIVKVGDTISDIEEGLNAGMWTIAVAKTGNEVGLSAEELELMGEDDRNATIIRARERLSRGGAHYVADSLEDVPQMMNEINRCLAAGGRP